MFSIHTRASTLTRTAGDFKFQQFEERFQNDGIVWTVGLTVEIKLHFQFFSDVMWTEPKVLIQYKPYLLTDRGQIIQLYDVTIRCCRE